MMCLMLSWFVESSLLSFYLTYIYYIYTIIMVFEWDENKNVSNKSKHGISFETAEKEAYYGIR